MLFIRSEVKVAMPHLRGGKDEMNATFFAEPFGIFYASMTVIIIDG
jgi:hypothetical protein